ncbi:MULTISPECIES: histone-like nucleoid-structuring protein Lsr2 [unclassified Arthrobacter]|jgi:hypothetical protein|uniref:histone-like nucleoid-structuring protein Lsr2 n=1 Tax=unclassified Arthrobacter TaxID=235627 RepID=UPI00042251AE|nr:MULTISPECIES: Lsr2 family protein [unclassified Arthrobacter]
MQRTQVQLIDDLNGQEAQETVYFGIDGTEYEIDLTSQNAAQLRSELSDYVEKGRSAANESTSKRRQYGSSTTRRKREKLEKIRQWALTNGHNPSARGRIQYSIVDAYNNAHK